jgi:hypothetical protein
MKTNIMNLLSIVALMLVVCVCFVAPTAALAQSCDNGGAGWGSNYLVYPDSFEPLGWYCTAAQLEAYAPVYYDSNAQGDIYYWETVCAMYDGLISAFPLPRPLPKGIPLGLKEVPYGTHAARKAASLAAMAAAVPEKPLPILRWRG